MESICIVGNGESLLRKKLGKKIDNHSIVVRCNKFRIKSFEKDVGIKTTHWICRASWANGNFKRWKNCEKYDEVWTFDGEIQSLKNAKKIIVLDGYEQLPEELKHIHPTSGLVAILYCINRWNTCVNIAGCGNSTEIKTKHYFNNLVNWERHDLDLERIFINKLIAEGKVRRLDEDYNSIS